MRLNRILIVTGDFGGRHLLATLLECLGYTCRQAVYIEAAFEQLRRYPADIVIIDHHLPWLDGISFLEHFNSVRDLGNPTLVLLTPEPLTPIKDQAFQNGAHAVIDRMCSLKDLLAAITTKVTQ